MRTETAVTTMTMKAFGTPDYTPEEFPGESVSDEETEQILVN
jgi:hypothetical protein